MPVWIDEDGNVHDDERGGFYTPGQLSSFARDLRGRGIDPAEDPDGAVEVVMDDYRIDEATAAFAVEGIIAGGY